VELKEPALSTRDSVLGPSGAAGAWGRRREPSERRAAAAAAAGRGWSEVTM